MRAKDGAGNWGNTDHYGPVKMGAPDIAEDAPSVVINLPVGWIMLSLPMQPVDTDRDSVLSSLVGKYSSIWRYNAVTGRWVFYKPDEGTGTLNEVEAKIGYWIDMKEPGELRLSGSPPGTTAIILEGEWNLVGYSSTESRGIEDCMSSIAGKSYSVWKYGNSTGKWIVYEPGPDDPKSLKTMAPGSSYWIRLKETDIGCVWDIGQ